MIKNLFCFFMRPGIFAFGVFAVSVLSVALALVAEHVFGLMPCILCIYQRIPFVLNAIVALVTLRLVHKNMLRGTGLLLAVAGVIFLANSALAFYHTGVEQKWWISAFEACEFDPSNLRTALSDQGLPPCDQIPWQDPILGISMAGYNFAFCLVAGILTLLYGLHLFRKQQEQT